MDRFKGVGIYFNKVMEYRQINYLNESNHGTKADLNSIEESYKNGTLDNITFVISNNGKFPQKTKSVCIYIINGNVEYSIFSLEEMEMLKGMTSTFKSKNEFIHFVYKGNFVISGGYIIQYENSYTIIEVTNDYISFIVDKNLLCFVLSGSSEYEFILSKYNLKLIENELV